MALTISTGFVVDDAIVMIENIVRFIEAGDPPLEAALKGAKQIGFTVVSLSVSLVAVFIPLFVHDRDRGTSVPRVCHHLERGSRRLGVRVADAHSDDVRQVIAIRRRRRTGAPGRVLSTHRRILDALLGIGMNAVCAGCWPISDSSSTLRL